MVEDEEDKEVAKDDEDDEDKEDGGEDRKTSATPEKSSLPTSPVALRNRFQLLHAVQTSTAHSCIAATYHKGAIKSRDVIPRARCLQLPGLEITWGWFLAQLIGK